MYQVPVRGVEQQQSRHEKFATAMDNDGIALKNGVRQGFPSTEHGRGISSTSLCSQQQRLETSREENAAADRSCSYR
jgi:hypothetical protein